MALIQRLTRLFRADFNAVLDRIEEPEALLRQAIRDMTDELIASETRLKARLEARESLANRRKQLTDRLTTTEAELDLCFGSGKDELARGVVRRKLETERLLARLETESEETDERLARMRAELDDNRATLESLKQKAALFASHPRRDGGDRDECAWVSRELTVSDADVEIAFLREQTARSAS